MLRFRHAEATDVPQMIEVVRRGFSDNLLGCTIFGCLGIQEYLEHTVADRGCASGIHYLVCVDDCDVLGFAEIRWTVQLLLVNHIFVVPPRQGKGIGTGLMLRGLESTRRLRQPHVQLDVFADNLSARRWYERLGFSPVGEQLWVQAGLSVSGCDRNRDWHVGGLAQADSVHAAYGFSEFDLHTRSSSYRIGRLGDRLFRSTNGSILASPDALAALGTLGRHRDLLCIDKAESICEHIPADATVLARSCRMMTAADPLVKLLADANRRRRVQHPIAREVTRGRDSLSALQSQRRISCCGRPTRQEG